MMPVFKKLMGQAMTEMTVSLVAIVPLFLLIPMLGKYIDIKHAAVQAARYEAWEYTVWYANNSDRPVGYTRPQPIKSMNQTRNEARQRFLSNTSLPIANTDSSGWDIASPNPLWKDHTGLALYNGAAETGSSQQGPLDTPNVSSENPVDDTLEIIKTFFKAMKAEIGYVGAGSGAPFTGIRDAGYYKSSVQLPVQTANAFLPRAAFRSDKRVQAPQNLVFSARAAVLADGWNSGGRIYTLDQTRGVSVTPLLNDSVMRTLGNDVAKYIGVPELKSDSLIWGYPLSPSDYPPNDIVPPDRLSSADTSSSAPLGYMQYTKQDCGPADSFGGGWRGPGLCQFKK